MSTELTWGGDVSPDDKTFALIAHLLAFVVPVIGPLVIYFIKKDSSSFVAYHAIQATVFQLIAMIISGATCGVGLLLMILSVMAALKANKGEWDDPYPLIGSVGR